MNKCFHIYSSTRLFKHIVNNLLSKFIYERSLTCRPFISIISASTVELPTVFAPVLIIYVSFLIEPHFVPYKLFYFLFKVKVHVKKNLTIQRYHEKLTPFSCEVTAIESLACILSDPFIYIFQMCFHIHIYVCMYMCFLYRLFCYVLKRKPYSIWVNQMMTYIN